MTDRFDVARHCARTARTGQGVLATLALLALAACGGGGDAGSSQYSKDSPTLVITSDNATTVARAGVAGLSLGQVGASLGGNSTAAASQVVVSQAHRAQALALRAAQAVRAQSTLTENCAVSGQIIYTLNDSNSDGLLDKAGESLNVAASHCKDSSGETTNGSFTATLSSYNGSSSLAIVLVFSQWSVSDSSGSSTIDGTIGTSVSGNQFTITSDTFSASSTDSTGVTHTFKMSDFKVTLTDDGSNSSESLAGTFALEDLGGQSVTISTSMLFTGSDSDDFPSQGTMLITGANGSTLRLDALSATLVKLSVNGNSPVTLNWSAID